MTEELTASSTPAGALFSRFRFEIPEFQREYAWQAKNEVSLFFSDLKDALDSEFYFLGLVVLTGTGNERTVVDGQQRILTLSLLAESLRIEAKELGRTATASEIGSNFLTALDYETDAQVPRVTLASAHDSSAFRQLTNVDAGSYNARPAGTDPGLLCDSFRLLQRNLASDLQDSDDSFKRIGKWTKFLTDSVHFAVFDHPNPASAYRVFEVVNTRGRGLTPSDLIKSYVLSTASGSALKRQYRRWSAISDRFRELEQDNVLPQFIRHSISARQHHIQPRYLYDEITRLYPDKKSVSRLLDCLESDLDLYIQMSDPSQPGPASDAQLAIYSALNELKVVTLRPILLALNNKDQPDEAGISFLRLVVRRIVVGQLGTGAVERRLGNAAGSIASGKSWESTLADLGDLNPSEAEFSEQFIGRAMNKRFLRYLHASARSGSIDVSKVDGLFLHQIRPRRAPDWDRFDDDAGATLTSTVGNAVLATVERRPRDANTWNGFKEHLLPSAASSAKSYLETLDVWTPHELKEHARLIGERASAVWYPR